MGYINSYYNPGPGINKDGKKKKGFFVFFEVLGAKFFKLIGANLLYFVSSLPFFVLAIFILAPQISNGFGLEGILDLIENPDTARTSMYTILACGIINFFGTGPASAGYAFVTRCFSRREHTWIFYDGWNKFKENLKNSFFLLIVDVLVIFLIMNASAIYSQIANGTQPVYMFIRYFLLVLFFVYIMSHIFVYQIMVTYECKFKELIKTSLIMAIANLPMCVLMIIITGLIFFAISLLGIVSPLVYAIVGLSFTRFPLEFFATRVIDKNIRMVKKKSAVREAENIPEKVEA